MPAMRKLAALPVVAAKTVAAPRTSPTEPSEAAPAEWEVLRMAGAAAAAAASAAAVASPVTSSFASPLASFVASFVALPVAGSQDNDDDDDEDVVPSPTGVRGSK